MFNFFFNISFILIANYPRLLKGDWCLFEGAIIISIQEKKRKTNQKKRNNIYMKNKKP
jgi:hypothetical protein